MKKFPIKIKRIYDSPLAEDGLRILVDRLWPRGISKERAKIDYWYKEITPSDGLRKWFGHKPERFNEFAQHYINELECKKPVLKEIKKLTDKSPVTLIYAAKDAKINHAIILKKVIDKS